MGCTIKKSNIRIMYIASDRFLELHVSIEINWTVLESELSVDLTVNAACYEWRNVCATSANTTTYQNKKSKNQ